MSLQAAIKKLEASELGGALALLLEVWRQTPDPRLADVLDALSEGVRRPPLPSASQQKTTQAFLELVPARDPEDLPRLLAVIGSTRSGLMVEQLEALLEHWPADPRTTKPLVQLLRKPPFTGSATQSAWRRLFKLLQQTGDPRTIAELGALDFDALLREVNGFRPGGVEDNAYAATFFTERSGATVKALEKRFAKGVPRLTDSDLAALERLRALSGAEPVAALVAQIHAEPASRGPREVLTDHLLERDDVRGQFMLLQQARAEGKLTPELEKEERALLEAHALKWVAPLAPVLDGERLVFERGFLAACALDPDREGVVKACTGHPLWSTVRHVELAGASFPRELLSHPVMKSLTEVTGIHDERARALLRGDDSFPWTGVGLDLPHYDHVADDTGLLAKHLLRVFPKVRALTLDGYSVEAASGAWLASPEFRHLERVGLTGGAASSIPGWIELLAGATPDAALEFGFGWRRGWEFRLLPGPKGPRTELEVASRAVQGWGTTKLLDLAKAAAPLKGRLACVRLRSRAGKAEREAFSRLLAPGGTLEG